MGKSRVNLGGMSRSPRSIEKRMNDCDGKMIIIFLYAKVERMALKKVYYFIAGTVQKHRMNLVLCL